MKNNVIIPTMLAVTVVIAGIFAFVPVDQASTVHTTQVLLGTAGLACASEGQSFLTTGNADNDVLDVVITPAMYVTSLTITHDSAEPIGIDLAVIETLNTAATAIDNLGAVDTGEDTVSPDITEVLNEIGLLDQGKGVALQAGAQITLTIDDAVDGNGALPDQSETITLEICGLVADPANFGADDIVVSLTAG